MNNMLIFSFKKGERLSSKKTFSTLFQSGKIVYSTPLKILFQRTDGNPYPACVAVSVPKRLYQRAVDRNLLKRRIREAYRLNKPEFYASLQSSNIQLNIVIQYQHLKIVDYAAIEKGLKLALEQVLQKLDKLI